MSELLTIICAEAPLDSLDTIALEETTGGNLRLFVYFDSQCRADIVISDADEGRLLSLLLDRAGGLQNLALEERCKR